VVCCTQQNNSVVQQNSFNTTDSNTGLGANFYFFKDLRNTIGNIPVEWYDDVDHFGYDLYGERITKQGSAKGEIDTFLTKLEDPDYW
jgi:hypothetical protein